MIRIIFRKLKLIYMMVFNKYLPLTCVTFTSFFYSSFLKIKRVNPIVSYSEKLIKENKIAKAVSFLVLVCKVNLAGGNYAKSKLFCIAVWYARSGHLKSGEAIIQKIHSKNIKQNLLLRYWNKFSCFDSKTVAKVNKYLNSGVSITSAQSAFKMLLHSTDNPKLLTKHHLEYLNIASYPKDKDFIKESLSTLKVLNEDDLIRAYLTRNSNVLPYCVDILALADGSFADLFKSNFSCETFYSKVKKGKEEIYRKLRDSNLSIAIVGNSPCEVGKNKGAEIDHHDIVIRFNKFSESNSLTLDYGEKCSIIVVTKSIVNDVSIQYPKNCDLIITGEDPLIYPPCFGYNSDLLCLFSNVSFMERSIYRELTNQLSATPSSGLQMLKLVHSMRTGFENVNLFGFSFDDQVGGNASSSSYRKKTKPSFRHNWIGENKYVNSLVNNLKSNDINYQSVRYDNSLGEPEEFKPIRIKILGDHSKYHCGSKAVIHYLTNIALKQGVLVTDDSYDLLIVNGEGSMHHDSKHHIEKMEALKSSIDRGLRGMLINTVWQENSVQYDDVLQKLDLVSTREELSRKELLSHNIIASRSLDFSYWAPIGWGKSFDYKNKIVVTDFYSKEFKTFVIINGGIESKFEYVDMKSISWTVLVKSLKSSSMLITGRHHAVYAACKAEVPFIAFKGNTHKIEGLIESSGIPIRLCNDRSEVPEMIEWVNNNRHLFEELFCWMRKQAKFTIPFELL